ncbi:thioesterase family protein [Staphylococcus caledonicus]|uniref:thioesterase family protein n=1 Tax=Staphylococcus sp. acrmy TaxID=2929076 RepID=UPI001F594724|nr:thioesterase family protein [Staphylococcus sp. acrmy]MCI2947873.1 thioesterase family protein [Staphylococcus sp. acrmy]
MSHLFTINKKVEVSQIDHNQHMHDAKYNDVFSEVISDFNYNHGLSQEERERYNYTTFSLEEHTTYLSELSLNTPYRIEVRIYDYDEKRVHFFLMLYKEENVLAATNEVMMMGIDKGSRRAAPFPKKYKEQIESYYKAQGDVEWPKQLGHQIGIPKKENK